jgi:hypothetical protein
MGTINPSLARVRQHVYLVVVVVVFYARGSRHEVPLPSLP